MRTAILASVSVLVFAGSAAAVDITACGQEVPDGQTGTLQNDLVCIVESSGVALRRNATLELNGFDVVGASNIGVYCSDVSCTINGPGALDANNTNVFLDDKVKLTARDVTISNGSTGITGGTGLGLGNKVRLEDVTLENNSEWGVIVRKIRAVGLVATGNAAGGPIAVHGSRIKATNLTATGNQGVGVSCAKCKITGLVATDNRDEGVKATGRLKLRDSTVLDNDTGGGGAADMVSGSRPKLSDTACGTSADPNGQTWGVCAND